MSTTTINDTHNKDQIKEPPKFAIMMYNDDYTPFDFVVAILVDIFHKTHDIAVSLANDAQKNSKTIIGTYTAEIAEMKINTVKLTAKHYKYPFKCEAVPA